MGPHPSTLLFVFSAIVTGIRGNFVTYYMDKNQGAVVSADSVRIETSLTRMHQANVNAWVVVKAASGFPTLTAYLRRFDLEKAKPDGSCYDYFNIYDGSSLSATRLNAKPLCGTNLDVTRYNSSGQTLTFQFVSDATAEMTGVEVIVTSVIRGKCMDASKQFQCSDNAYCMAKSLRCDTYQHCVDGSDEAASLCAAIAAEANSILYGIIIGSIVGGIALAILLIFLICYCIREHKYRRLLAQLRRERSKKNRIGPVVENEYPVTNRYRKREFKPMFRNENIEKKDWGLYHGPLYDPAYLRKLKAAGGDGQEEKERMPETDTAAEAASVKEEREEKEEKALEPTVVGPPEEGVDVTEEREEGEKALDTATADTTPLKGEVDSEGTTGIAGEAKGETEKERRRREQREEKERKEREKKEEKERKAREKKEEKERLAQEKREEKERKAREKKEEKERKEKEKEEEREKKAKEKEREVEEKEEGKGDEKDGEGKDDEKEKDGEGKGEEGNDELKKDGEGKDDEKEKDGEGKDETGEAKEEKTVAEGESA